VFVTGYRLATMVADKAVYLADGTTDWPLARPEERFYLLTPGRLICVRPHAYTK
jgi:predicted metal-dependent peptidase